MSDGIRWALVATLALGLVDFGIGASAESAGWFLPVFWTRAFSLVGLGLAMGCRLCWRPARRSMNGPSFPASMLLWHRLPGSLFPEPGDRTTRDLVLWHQVPRETRAGSPVPRGMRLNGLLVAFATGVMENAAVLLFSIDTRVARTGIASAIASCSSLFTVILAIVLYGERLTPFRWGGVTLVSVGLALLAVLP